MAFTRNRSFAGERSLPIVLVALVAACLGSSTALAEPMATLHLQSSESPDDAVRAIELEQSKSLVLTTEYNVKRVSVGDATILDVNVLSAKEVHLIPKSIGTTNVIVWDNSGKPQAVIDVDIATAFTHIERDMRRILASPDLEVDRAGSSIVLRGRVPDTLTAEKAVTLARSFFSNQKSPPEILSLLEVGGHHQVMIEVVLAEMSRSMGREIGTNFSALIERNGEPIQILSLLDALSGLDENESTSDTLLISEAINLIGQFPAGSGFYTVLIDALKETSIGQILAEPTLIARSGETARFLSGGEVPIPIAQGGAFGSVTILFKEFGIAVAFTPTVLTPDRIHLKVSPEVSEPDFTLGTSVSGTTVPGFATRRAQTAVELGDGETFAIAGLLSDQVNEIAVKYPLLGDIPVLGILFRSTQFQRNETELVILVTPRLVGPLGPYENGPALPTDHFVPPNDIEFYLLGWLEGLGERKPRRRSSGAGMIGEGGYRLPPQLGGDEL